MSCIKNIVVVPSIGVVWYGARVLRYWNREIAKQLWRTVFIMSARNMQTEGVAVCTEVRGSVYVSAEHMGWVTQCISFNR